MLHPPNPLFELLAEKTALPREMHRWKDVVVASCKPLELLRTKVVLVLLLRRLACRAIARLPPLAIPTPNAALFCLFPGSELLVDVVVCDEIVRFRANPFYAEKRLGREWKATFKTCILGTYLHLLQLSF